MALVMALVVAALVVVASPASACSCGALPFQPDQDFGWGGIDEYDAVFIGTATDRRPIGVGAGREVVWTFDIDSVVTGDLATPIEVVTPEEGGACGLDTVSVGDRRAIGLRFERNDWRSDLCSQDEVAALDGLGERREPSVAAPSADQGDLSTGSGWGLTLVGVGFGAVVGAAVMATVLAGRRRTTNGD